MYNLQSAQWDFVQNFFLKETVKVFSISLYEQHHCALWKLNLFADTNWLTDWLNRCAANLKETLAEQKIIGRWYLLNVILAQYMWHKTKVTVCVSVLPSSCVTAIVQHYIVFYNKSVTSGTAKLVLNSDVLKYLTGIRETSTCYSVGQSACIFYILIRTDHFICCRTKATLICTKHGRLRAGLWMATWTLLEAASSTAPLMPLFMGWQEEQWHTTLQALVLFTIFGGDALVCSIYIWLWVPAGFVALSFDMQAEQLPLECTCS